MYLASLDISSSFSHINILESSRKFTQFKFGGQWYHMNCVAQGGTNSPEIFCYLIKIITKVLHRRQIGCFWFVDDSIVYSQTKDNLLKSIEVTQEVLTKAGFLINLEKSQLVPTQQIEFLGFYIDTVEFTVSITREKRKSIYTLVSNVLKNPSQKISIRHLVKIIGKIVATFPASEEAPLHYRILDRFKVKCLKRHNNNWNARICLMHECLQELTWWKNNIFTDVMKKSLRDTKITARVYSDSSQHSFGGWYKQHNVSSRFSELQQKLSINTKELLAIYYTLSTFAKLLQNQGVLHFSDSQVACYCITSKGSSDPLRDRITRKIFALAKKFNFSLKVSWLSTTKNCRADSLSRRVPSNKSSQPEFTIPKDILYPAIKKCVSWWPEIDLFSSFLSNRFKLYCSYRNDPFSVIQNCFNLDWSKYKCYVFCCSNIMPRVLKQINEQRVEHCLILTELFPSAAHFTRLMEMSTQPPLLLPPDTAKRLYLPWDTSIRHPLARHMRLILVPLSVDCFHTMVSNPSRPYSLVTMHGENLVLKDIPLPRSDGLSSVKRRKLADTG